MLILDNRSGQAVFGRFGYNMGEDAAAQYNWVVITNTDKNSFKDSAIFFETKKQAVEYIKKTKINNFKF